VNLILPMKSQLKLNAQENQTRLISIWYTNQCVI
jgi:hypothetical protein